MSLWYELFSMCNKIIKLIVLNKEICFENLAARRTTTKHDLNGKADGELSYDSTV